MIYDVRWNRQCTEELFAPQGKGRIFSCLGCAIQSQITMHTDLRKEKQWIPRLKKSVVKYRSLCVHLSYRIIQQVISPSLTCEVARLYLSQPSSRSISSLGGYQFVQLFEVYIVYKHQENIIPQHPFSQYWKTGCNMMFSKPTRCLWLDRTAKVACLPGQQTSQHNKRPPNQLLWDSHTLHRSCHC